MELRPIKPRQKGRVFPVLVPMIRRTRERREHFVSDKASKHMTSTARKAYLWYFVRHEAGKTIRIATLVEDEPEMMSPTALVW
jgi:hypothetical protein